MIGGLDVRVNRNHFGRQTESFATELDLSFLGQQNHAQSRRPFNGIFIRAPIVEKLLPQVNGEQVAEAQRQETVVAPAKASGDPTIVEELGPVEVMATLPGRNRSLKQGLALLGLHDEIGDVVAVRQGKVFGTSFHPELTDDSRIHEWWLEQVREDVHRRRK